MCLQLNQALAGKFNAHVHVEYEWCLQHEDLDESDEDLDEKVRDAFVNNNSSFFKDFKTKKSFKKVIRDKQTNMKGMKTINA